MPTNTQNGSPVEQLMARPATAELKIFVQNITGSAAQDFLFIFHIYVIWQKIVPYFCYSVYGQDVYLIYNTVG
jgi:hypothetical protein